MNEFNTDPYPGKPKILFIGHGSSSHTISWIDSLQKAELNIRIFCIPGTLPTNDWWCKAYITVPTEQLPVLLDETKIQSFYPTLKKTELLYHELRTKKLLSPFGWAIGSLKLFLRLLKKRTSLLSMDWEGFFYEKRTEVNTYYDWLAKIIMEWQPDIIHTLGMDPAGFFFSQIRDEYKLHYIGKWVLQLRGGSDLTLSRYDKKLLPKIIDLTKKADQIISDNIINFKYLEGLKTPSDKFSPLSPIPGTGGIPVKELASAWQENPSRRRIIVWPKAYDCEWSVALPVFEAIKIAWNHIQPCTIYMMAMDTEMTKKWYNALPEEILDHCQVFSRIPRKEFLNILPKARIMLAPSLVDGIPNSLYEAMSSGCLPIVSPIETINTMVENEKNVLFARNLYPDEIASALIRAMNDDELVDRIALNNLNYVQKIADRDVLTPRIIEYYQTIANK